MEFLQYPKVNNNNNKKNHKKNKVKRIKVKNNAKIKKMKKKIKKRKKKNKSKLLTNKLSKNEYVLVYLKLKYINIKKIKVIYYIHYLIFKC